MSRAGPPPRVGRLSPSLSSSAVTPLRSARRLAPPESPRACAARRTRTHGPHPGRRSAGLRLPVSGSRIQPRSSRSGVESPSARVGTSRRSGGTACSTGAAVLGPAVLGPAVLGSAVGAAVGCGCPTRRPVGVRWRSSVTPPRSARRYEGCREAPTPHRGVNGTAVMWRRVRSGGHVGWSDPRSARPGRWRSAGAQRSRKTRSAPRPRLTSPSSTTRPRPSRTDTPLSAGASASPCRP